MDEYSRIVIEEYCFTHKTKKSQMLSELLEMSYDPASDPGDEWALYLERAIDREKNPELKGALQDLDDYLFGW